MYKREIVRGNRFPADKQSAIAVMPTIRSLDHPASWLLAPDRSGEWRFASATDVWPYSSRAGFLFRLLVVVALVQADVLWPAWATWREKHDGVHRVPQHVLVVNVGARQRHRQRDPVRVGQNVAFGAEFCAIGRVWTGKVPPFGAFTLALSSEHQLKSRPTSRS